MKSLFFVLLASGVIFSASSCKKCGYCEDPVNGNSSSVCKDNKFGGLLDEYEEAESNCQANGGRWVVTK